MNRLEFTVYMKPEPQGSTRAWVIPGTNRASVTTDNPKMKPFRSEVTRMALSCLQDPGPMFVKGTPVRVEMVFTFRKPASAKKRFHPVVKPDIDKLQRAILDALTGVAFDDDAQVVVAVANKKYGALESASVVVTEELQGA